ncbi:hypothetical protein JR316_0001657 [Psilocybe cubensis]|uniref:Uncharacterized protein n=1 Tax=Psilocybe cubensis TaxID=181762 RepID=A0ACB8HAP8_PSICU|nr:hypothetical protein JR316_0001657 [Psilocybe cubensis]KAH9484757.1 hypothetical protein JR316_0001657 [Psilocybe cubensis]
MSATTPTDNDRKPPPAGPTQSGGAIPPAVYPQYPPRLPAMGQNTCKILPGQAHPPGQPCNVYTHPPGRQYVNGQPITHPNYYHPQPSQYGSSNGYPPQHYPPQHDPPQRYPPQPSQHSPEYHHPQPNPYDPNGYPPQYGQGNYHPSSAGYYYKGPPGDQH